MNSNEQFDELARQKLAERDFPFQEAHWLDAQRAIATQRRGRRGGALWIAGGALAVILGAWLLWPSSDGMQLGRLDVGTTARPMEAGAAGSAPANEEMTNARTAEGTGTDAQPSSIALVPASTVEATASTATGGESASYGHRHDPPAHALRTQSVPDERSAAVIPSRTIAAANSTNMDLAQGTNAQQGDALPTEGPGVTVSSLPPDLPAASSTDVSLTPNDGTTHQHAATADDLASSKNLQTTGDDPGTAGVDSASVGASDSKATTAFDAGGSLAPGTGPGTDASASTGTDSVPAPLVTIEPKATPPVAAAAPPLISPRSPWELAALFGAFNSTSTYSGGNSASWNVSPERTYGGGAEIVRMGRNAGLGIGIHYGSYADRLRTPGESRSELSTTRSWFLDPVDTTILIVTGFDTATGFFTTQNVNVTINQLRMTLDSSYASVVIREARERINRTSYLEAVGLLDAHLVQGRWTIGVRGGPSVGLLTTRSGSIPSNGAEEITFNDAAMQRFVLGWTARAYVRYRFNSAWSVGIEPAMRGQLGDGFVQDGVARRSNAIGGLISVSYRLP